MSHDAFFTTRALCPGLIKALQGHVKGLIGPYKGQADRALQVSLVL